jgi:DNA-binding PadR family transcriptional regulator
MSVRGSLLAILDQGPCYGYQLRAEFDRRTGSVWPLNVGQIYNTLDRLEREGLVAKGEIDDEGHVYWEITDAGRAGAREWLTEPLERPQGGRDELAVKIALAATLPGADVSAVIHAERLAALARLESLAEAKTPHGSPDHREEFARALVVDAMISRAEAEVRWLDRTEDRLAVHQHHTMALGLSTARPKRGRPAKFDTSAA